MSFNLQKSASMVLIHLLKGVLYKDKSQELWRDLLTYQAAVRDYFTAIGLQVFIDETEGYAFLQQRQDGADENGAGGDGSDTALPRLVQRRPLSYPVSLLCVLLRKKLIEQDATGGETRLIISREQMVDMLRVFLPATSNEAKMIEQIGSHIGKIEEYGFLRRLKGDEERFEVRRIIKALVDADWLTDFEKRLEEYQAYADTSA